MIQLTKGTNVLDINLSDFSGAGQDVVQNGSFNDIGSDLVQNGDFAEIGSELITNGDFSAAGINLVTNPNFTDTGSDVVINGTFATDTNWSKNSNWTISGGEAISDGTSSATINQSSILTEGVSYKISFEITEYTSGSGYSVRAGAGTTYSTAVTSLGVHTFYQVATGNPLYGNTIYIKASGDTIGKITNVTAEPLGEDWSEIVSDPDSVSFVENGVKIVQGSDVGLDNRVFQGSVTEDDKSYKVTYTIHSISLTSGNSVKYYNGTAYVVLPEQGVGTHTFYYTRQGTDGSWYFNLSTPVTSATDFVTISSLVVQELGEGWNFNTPPWGVVSNGIASDGANSNDMNQSTWFPVLGKSYKIVYTIASITQGSYKITLGGQTTTPRSAAATYTEYITATDLSNGGGRLRIQIDNDNAIGTISSISVKEVGQDWTLGTGASIGENKLVINGGSGFVAYQPSIVYATGYYKLSFLVSNYVSGNILGRVSNVNGDVTFTGDGLKTAYIQGSSGANVGVYCTGGFIGDVTDIVVQQLDTNNRWVTFADPDSKSVMKLGQVDLEIDSSGNNSGVYQTGLIKPNKLYIITINMKATAAIYVEIAASLGTAVSAVIGTELLTTSYKEYSFEYVTPFAVDHDLQIHRLFGSGANQTISIDYVSMNGVDESQWINDPTWDPFATSLVFVPTLTDESTNNSKQFTLDTSISDGGWDGRSLHGQVIINEFPIEVPASGIINLKQPDFLEGFYQVEIRGYLGTFYRILGKCMAHLERTSTEDGYNRFESYNDTVTYKAYEE